MVSLKTESYVLRRNLQGRKSTYGTRYQNQTVRQTDRYTDSQTDGFCEIHNRQISNEKNLKIGKKNLS